MFIQTQETPNPNSLKFLPGKKVSNDGPYEFLNENQTEIPILKNILSINGVTGIFLSEDFLSINKSQDEKWEKKEQFLFCSKKFGDDSDRALIKPNGNLTYFMSDIIYHQNKVERFMNIQYLRSQNTEHY